MNAIEFEAPFSDTLIEVAAKSLVRQSLERFFGWKFLIAGTINIIAFVLILALWPSTLAIWVIGFIAIAPPVYFLLALAIRPRKVGAILRERLQPSAHISLGSDSFTVAANGRSATMLWGDVKKVIEFKDYFLFMLQPIGGAVVPRSNMPAEGDGLIRELARTRGIFSVGK
jgi:YcxB-like protein